jgi:Ohr subfamily peroxiredoxin
MTAKTLFSGTTHVTGGRNGHARSADGFVDLALPAPHPAAEQLFAAAWSACFIGALELAASQRKIKLPASPELDTTIDLLMENNAFFLKARLDVAVPGVDIETAQELAEAAHAICPYSKAVNGNIEIEINVRALDLV